MKRSVRLALTIAALAAPAAAQAPLDPGARMPPGHPPVGQSAPAAPAKPVVAPDNAPAASSGEPPPAGSGTAAGENGNKAESLPPGHPDMPPGHPQVAAPEPQREAPPQDALMAVESLPSGTVEVEVRDPASRPLVGQLVEVLITKQDVEEGDQKERRSARTNELGIARFADLPRGTAYSYRAMVARDGATYSSQMFQPDERRGHKLLLHAYPVVGDIQEALVGLRGVLFVQPREDVFQVELNYRVFNIGRVAWVPDDLRLDLPTGAKAFQASDGDFDARVEAAGEGRVRIAGTFPPGQRDVTYRFQLENDRTTSRSFRVELPPHVAEIRVIAEAGPTMQLDVEGFPPSERMRGQDGSRLAVTGRQLRAGEQPITGLSVTLDGIPAPSQGRWFAAFLAVAFAAGGFSIAFRGKSEGLVKSGTAEARRAEKLLLDELVLLEKLHSRGDVGEKTYEQTRNALLDAIARLEGLRKAMATPRAS